MNKYLNTIKQQLLNDNPIENTPLVSIIMPLYNYERYVLTSINSVVNQTYKNWELIIIDDCSTDNSYNVVQSYIKTLSNLRITLLRNSENKHVSYTRNRGISLAKGKYIATLDADDILDKELLNEYVYIAESRGADVVHCTAVVFDKEDLISVDRPTTLQDKEPYYFVIPPMQMFVRREVFDVLKYNENNKGGEDTELCIRIFERGFRRTEQLWKPLFYYRRHSGSYDDISVERRILNIARIVLDNPNVYSKYHIMWATQVVNGEDVSKLANPYLIVPDLIQLIMEYEADSPYYEHILEQIKSNYVDQIVKVRAEKSYYLSPFTLELSPNESISVLPTWYAYGEMNSSIGIFACEYKNSICDLSRSQSMSNYAYSLRICATHFKKCVENGEELVSIVIAVCDLYGSLDNTISSISDLSYRNREVVVVEDTLAEDMRESSISLCSKYANEHIEVYGNHFSYGLNTTFNAAIKRSNGNYVVLLHSGELIAEDFVERGMKEIHDSGVDIVYSGLYEQISGFDAMDMGLRSAYLLLLEMDSGVILLRRDVWERICGFNEQFWTDKAELLDRYKQFNFVSVRL